jgi:hypothetical protein
MAQVMHGMSNMTTRTFDYSTHDHAGARWLARATPAILFAALTGFLMLVYPHL